MTTILGKFQSPIHRGCYSDAYCDYLQRATTSGFNPLFIGAAILTAVCFTLSNRLHARPCSAMLGRTNGLRGSRSRSPKSCILTTFRSPCPLLRFPISSVLLAQARLCSVCGAETSPRAPSCPVTPVRVPTADSCHLPPYLLPLALPSISTSYHPLPKTQAFPTCTSSPSTSKGKKGLNSPS